VSVEQLHGWAWASCRRCGWEGPLRVSTVEARDDELDHERDRHPRRRRGDRDDGQRDP